MFDVCLTFHLRHIKFWCVYSILKYTFIPLLLKQSRLPCLHVCWCAICPSWSVDMSCNRLSVLRQGHVSFSLTSFMTPPSLSDEFIPTKEVPFTYDPSTMNLFLESYNSSGVTVFLSTQTRSSCFLENMMTLCQYFQRLRYNPYSLHVRGLVLSSFRALVYDLLSGVLGKKIARRVSQSQFWRPLFGGHLSYLVPFPPFLLSNNSSCVVFKFAVFFFWGMIRTLLYVVATVVNLCVVEGFAINFISHVSRLLYRLWKIEFSQGLVVTMWRAAAWWSPFATARPWGGTIPGALPFLVLRESDCGKVKKTIIIISAILCNTMQHSVTHLPRLGIYPCL